jgi:hypothetical protein
VAALGAGTQHNLAREPPAHRLTVTDNDRDPDRGETGRRRMIWTTLARKIYRLLHPQPSDQEPPAHPNHPDANNSRWRRRVQRLWGAVRDDVLGADVLGAADLALGSAGAQLRPTKDLSCGVEGRLDLARILRPFRHDA